MNYVEITVHFFYETDAAILVSDDDTDGSAVWLPKSKIQCPAGGVQRHDVIEVTMPEWLAIEKGLI